MSYIYTRLVYYNKVIILPMIYWYAERKNQTKWDVKISSWHRLKVYNNKVKYFLPT